MRQVAPVGWSSMEISFGHAFVPIDALMRSSGIRLPISLLLLVLPSSYLTLTGLPTTYLYLATTTDNFVGYLTNRARGAAYPTVTVKDFEEAEITKPNHSLVSAFDEFANPLFA